VLINKIDTLDYFNFNFDASTDMIKFRNPNSTIIKISALKGENIEKVKAYLIDKITDWRKK
jgi:hydrogenase nickel incorporation protein HypB